MFVDCGLPQNDVFFGASIQSRTQRTLYLATEKLATTTNLRARIGYLDACLNEDLVSVNPILDAGFTLTMERNEGLFKNETTGASIKVRREGERWSIDLEDLANARLFKTCF